MQSDMFGRIVSVDDTMVPTHFAIPAVEQWECGTNTFLPAHTDNFGGKDRTRTEPR